MYAHYCHVKHLVTSEKLKQSTTFIGEILWKHVKPCENWFQNSSTRPIVVNVAMSMMSYYSEKFLLKLNDCRQNIDSSHNDLRYNPDLSDITLVCEEDQQVEAHTLIFSAISPFFRNVFKRYRHSHPMIYIRGPYIMSQCGVHLPWRSKSPHIGPRRIHCSDGRYLTKCAGRVRDAKKKL